MSKPLSWKSGFSYIEVLIATGILIIVTHVFFTLIIGSYNFLNLSRTQTTARGLAVQQMELLRNLPYAEIGTQAGIPAGSIPQISTRTINGQIYTLNTLVTYVDNPLDGTNPADTIPADYKRIKVEVSWDSISNGKGSEITLFADISPRNGQETLTAGGTITVNVFDSYGQPLSQADVHITANTLSPPIDLIVNTNINGQINLPASPACSACYQLIVSKEGYSTDRTYSTQEIANPLKANLTVINNQVSSISFAIDQVSSIKLISYDYESQNIKSNATFYITGAKILGSDSSGNTLYKYNQEHTTNASGELDLELEWDNYSITPANNELFAGSSQHNPININPNSDKTIPFAVANSSDYSILTEIKDASMSAIPTAEVIVNSVGFSTTLTTGNLDSATSGFAFSPLPQIGAYTISVSHPNFLPKSIIVDITSNHEQPIIMNSL